MVMWSCDLDLKWCFQFPQLWLSSPADLSKDSNSRLGEMMSPGIRIWISNTNSWRDLRDSSSLPTWKQNVDTTSLHLHVTSFQGWTNMQISTNIWLGALSHRILHGTVVPAGSQQVLPGIQSKAANAASLMIACRTIAGVSFSHTDAKIQNSLPFLKTSKIEAQTVACSLHQNSCSSTLNLTGSPAISAGS